MKVDNNVRKRRTAGGKWKPAAVILAAILAFLSLPLMSGAAETDGSGSVQNGSLTVVPGNDQLVEDLASANVQVDIYRIADAQKVSGYDTYSWEYTKPFASITVPNSPDVTNEEWEAAAQEAAKVVLGKHTETSWDPSLTAADIQSASPTVYYTQSVTYSTTGNGDISNVAASFTDLPAGMYLILAHGDTKSIPAYAEQTEEGKYVTVANSRGYKYTFKPELITIPTKDAEIWEGETEERYNTANRGPWIFDPVVTLKPEQAVRLGDLRITKKLNTYAQREKNTQLTTDQATFIFDVLVKESSAEDAAVVYHDYISIAFDAFSESSEKSAVIKDLPVGSYAVVKEIYPDPDSGVGLYQQISADGTKTVPANDEVTASFTNEYNGQNNGGGSVTNKFTYKAGATDLESGWEWQQVSDDSENAEVIQPKAE